MFTCLEVAEYYRMSALRCEAELSGVVATVVETAAVRARSYIGKKQEDWAPLSTATIFGFHHPAAGWLTGKDDRGFSGPDYQPLLGDTGHLQESISSEVDGLMGIVGSDDKIGLYQEMGTAEAEYPIPPRPFLAKALMEAEVDIEALAGDVAVSLLIPRA
jgi:hypothetical protein